MKSRCEKILGIIACALIWISGVSTANAEERQAPGVLAEWTAGLFDEVRMSPSLHVSVSSYRPELEAFAQLLETLGAPRLDAAPLVTLSLHLQHSSAVSSRLGIGYWTNDTEVPPPLAQDLSAAMVPISLEVLYRPVLLARMLPLYLGGGLGYSHLSVDGSAVDLLEQQGFSVEEGDSGLTGFVLMGLEFPIVDERAFVNVEIRRILKTFETGGDSSQPLAFEFDGTAIGLGIGLRFR